MLQYARFQEEMEMLKRKIEIELERFHTDTSRRALLRDSIFRPQWY